ncbi:unnamed protein product [Oncorhynchus mykiss]|uniref:Fibrous sheath-interacting protein 1 n=1 Tax=Oncorhynchus mykiss TaxID=8022 RepID=A0A060X394_ONCMY|nr:unnamed protein product [Oncorhynchus mykiss]
MDITRGSLDDISRPASNERSRPGSRVSTVSLPDVGRVFHPSPTSLVVLSDDAPNNKQPIYVSDEENEDPELQKAIKKMKILDKILASRISNEKEVKRKGKELHQKLWQELLPNRSSEWADEAENTRMFLSLAPSSTHGSSEELDFAPVFGTQVPDKEYERHNRQDLNTTAADLAEVCHEERADESEGSWSGVPRGKNKQDFVKKNIELASGAGGPVQMTQEEKYRLEELLRDMEEGDNAGKAGCEVGQNTALMNDLECCMRRCFVPRFEHFCLFFFPKTHCDIDMTKWGRCRFQQNNISSSNPLPIGRWE